jgi:hypothetical protein
MVCEFHPRLLLRLIMKTESGQLFWPRSLGFSIGETFRKESYDEQLNNFISPR